MARKILDEKFKSEESKYRYRAQFIYYITRYQEDFKQVLDEYIKKKQVDNNCVAVHIRRTDKVQKETDLVEDEKYFNAVKEYYKNNFTKRRCVYLATDDKNIPQKIHSQYTDFYQIIFELEHIGYTDRYDYSKNKLIYLLKDLYAMEQCGYYVGTGSSNIYRYIYQWKALKGDGHSKKMMSLDSVTQFP